MVLPAIGFALRRQTIPVLADGLKRQRRSEGLVMLERIGEQANTLYLANGAFIRARCAHAAMSC